MVSVLVSLESMDFMDGKSGGNTLLPKLNIFVDK